MCIYPSIIPQKGAIRLSASVCQIYSSVKVLPPLFADDSALSIIALQLDSGFLDALIPRRLISGEDIKSFVERDHQIALFPPSAGLSFPSTIFASAHISTNVSEPVSCLAPFVHFGKIDFSIRDHLPQKFLHHLG